MLYSGYSPGEHNENGYTQGWACDGCGYDSRSSVHSAMVRCLFFRRERSICCGMRVGEWRMRADAGGGVRRAQIVPWC